MRSLAAVFLDGERMISRGALNDVPIALSYKSISLTHRRPFVFSK
jgi:hypothetical protein